MGHGDSGLVGGVKKKKEQEHGTALKRKSTLGG